MPDSPYNTYLAERLQSARELGWAVTLAGGGTEQGTMPQTASSPLLEAARYLLRLLDFCVDQLRVTR